VHKIVKANPKARKSVIRRSGNENMRSALKDGSRKQDWANENNFDWREHL